MSFHSPVVPHGKVAPLVFIFARFWFRVLTPVMVRHLVSVLAFITATFYWVLICSPLCISKCLLYSDRFLKHFLSLHKPSKHLYMTSSECDLAWRFNWLSWTNVILHSGHFNNFGSLPSLPCSCEWRLSEFSVVKTFLQFSCGLLNSFKSCFSLKWLFRSPIVLNKSLHTLHLYFFGLRLFIPIVTTLNAPPSFTLTSTFSFVLVSLAGLLQADL